MMLDDAARAAGSGFACMFSTADEYEAALIAERRAEGRYRSPKFWPVAMAVGCGLTAVGAALLIL
jgi:putative N-acetylmannosamine-6-phosphate epimerase